MKIRCFNCGGSGEIEKTLNNGGHDYDAPCECGECLGTGEIEFTENEFPGCSELTEGEIKFFETLWFTDGDTLWHHAIDSVCRTQSLIRFRMLVKELLSQAHDNPELMRTILGRNAYEALINLEKVTA